ncbi:unnamed protein product [Rotaria magnacalcarata]|nr:unnamed protein product [Rotaria magnacalcarata]
MNVACTTSGRGTLKIVTGGSATWTQYQLNYTASTTSRMIMFGFHIVNSNTYYLDSVSIVDRNAPSIELLMNPSFESSTTILIDWTQWCTTGCSTSSWIVSGSNCHLGVGNCFQDSCIPSSGIDFLTQSFTASVGDKYTISFWIRLVGPGPTPLNKLYVDIV